MNKKLLVLIMAAAGFIMTAHFQELSAVGDAYEPLNGVIRYSASRNFAGDEYRNGEFSMNSHGYTFVSGVTSSPLPGPYFSRYSPNSPNSNNSPNAYEEY